jgi:CBS domain-containing protein
MTRLPGRRSGQAVTSSRGRRASVAKGSNAGEGRKRAQMSRTDAHLEGMLRHLGAAYYDSLQGRATQADVARAVDTVTEHLNGKARPPASSAPEAAQRVARDGSTGWETVVHGWSRRVSDVMATSVVTVDRVTPYKEIARLLAEHRISGVPVLKMGREVAGVVTEADLLSAETKTTRRLRSAGRMGWPPRARRHPALTAGELMSAPAITVGPQVTVHAASRLMGTHHIRLLPVVDERSRLIGVVSRRDLLAVFLRPDEDIAADVRKVLEEILLAEPGQTEVAVRDGIVTLTGALDPTTGAHRDLLPVAIRLMWEVDGVVDIIDRLGRSHPPTTQATPPAQSR